MTDAPSFQTIGELIAAARAAIEPGLYAWATAGAGEEVTLARNEAALNRLALVPRLMAGLESVDTGTTLLGVPLSVPVVLAPVGALSLYHPGDAAEAARGAAEVGVSVFCATQITTSTWAEVADTRPGEHFFQMYVLGDREWMARVADHVEECGFAGLAVTADSPAIGRRDRSITSGYVWTVERDKVPHNLVEFGVDESARRRFGWSDLEWLCSRSSLPVILKGVCSADDARRAVDAGASAVYVSNHGGRTVDHAVSTVEVLESIVHEVAGEAEVVVDGGFTRGSEIVAALALGARAVGLGKLQCLALSHGGASGVEAMLRILATEIEVTMTNLGCGTVADIARDRVTWTMPAEPGLSRYG